VVGGVSSGFRIACLWVPCFVAAAVERCEPALVGRPLVVIRGTPPAGRVVEANPAAREQGVVPGMTETEARTRCPAVVSRPWLPEQVTAAQHALLEAALAVSPRVEEAAPGLVYADVAGLQRLVGDDCVVGERLVSQARAVGLPARVGIAGSRPAARVAARTGRMRVVVVEPGHEEAVLSGAPVSALDLPPEVEAVLTRWGVRTVGELARLPREGLAARLGPAGLRAHDLAVGRDPDPFQPWTPPPGWEERQELDWEVQDLETLSALLRRVLERLTTRLTAAHLAADVLHVELRLASGARERRALALAHPTQEPAPLLGLVRRDLQARPPAAPVTGVGVSARAVRVVPAQSQLGMPPPPRRRDLATLTVRLAELVGTERVGSPRLLDSHRPDAVGLAPFEGEPESQAAGRVAGANASRKSGPGREQVGRRDEPTLALRRYRPPVTVEVTVAEDRPLTLRRGEVVHRVTAHAGPWRMSGEWWDRGAWARDEWDVLLEDGTLCRLAHDRVTGAWTLDGVYD
jgi:protein ImuB